MFVFKPTNKTYSDPIAATFVPGIPFGREKSKGDICLLHTGFASSKIYLNSKVLREAILNSKDYLEEVLQLRITDKVGKEPKKVQADASDAEVYIPNKPVTVTVKGPTSTTTGPYVTVGTIENTTVTTVTEEVEKKKKPTSKTK